MPQFTGKVCNRGISGKYRTLTVTIPKELAERCGIGGGDYLNVDVKSKVNRSGQTIIFKESEHE